MGLGKSFIGLVAVLALLALVADVSAQGPGSGRGGRGGKPSFERLLEAFDANADSALEETEVPARVWERLSQADGNDDGYVTREEFDSYRPAGR